MIKCSLQEYRIQPWALQHFQNSVVEIQTAGFLKKPTDRDPQHFSSTRWTYSLKKVSWYALYIETQYITGELSGMYIHMQCQALFLSFG